MSQPMSDGVDGSRECRSPYWQAGYQPPPEVSTSFKPLFKTSACTSSLRRFQSVSVRLPVHAALPRSFAGCLLHSVWFDWGEGIPFGGQNPERIKRRNEIENVVGNNQHQDQLQQQSPLPKFVKPSNEGRMVGKHMPAASSYSRAGKNRY